MTKQPTRACGYARVSRPDEREILANQVRSIRTHAGRLGIELEAVLEETASGGKDDRVAINGLLARVEARGGPKAVVFTSLSRMTGRDRQRALHTEPAGAGQGGLVLYGPAGGQLRRVYAEDGKGHHTRGAGGSRRGLTA